jgi:hypothetical protein
MMKSLRLLSLAALLTTGTAAMSMAATDASPESSGSKSVTGTQTRSQQQNVPATGSAAPMTNQRMSNGGVAGLSAQTPGNGNKYPGVVGPTGSTQSDATNPNRIAPNGGGGGSRN